jgi:hypothetical protein
VLDELDLATSTGELARQGFCEGLVLAPQLVDALVSFALLGTCYGDSGPSRGFSDADRATAEAASGRRFPPPHRASARRIALPAPPGASA